jgi:putative transposase
MPCVTFENNTLFLMDGNQFRFKKKFGLDWQIESVQTGLISNLTEQELFSLYTKNLITFPHLIVERPKLKKNDSFITECFGTMPEDIRMTLINRRSYLECHIDAFGNSLALKDVAESLDKFWVEAFGPKPHVHTAHDWLKKYWDSGKDITALRAGHHRKGNKTKRIKKKVEELCRQAINEFFLTKDRRSKKFTLDQAHGMILKENVNLAEPYKLKFPSIHFLSKLIDSLNAFDVCIARYGKDYARNRFRHSILSGEQLYPLQKFQVDHTQIDVILVDEFGHPIGRPWLTLIIEVYTRVIIGYEITFEHPSYKSVAKALLHAILPKTNQRIDYPDTVADYIMYGIPESIFGDNGPEFHGYSYESMCYELGTTVGYTGRKTPWDKPHIEGVNDTANSGITEYLPGRTFSNIAEKADNNPVKDARITFDSFKKIVNKWIVDIYHQTVHSTLGMTPAQCWDEFVNKEQIKLPSDVNRVKHLAMESESRKLQHYGIEINKITYNNQDLGDLRKRLGLDLKLEVYWDKDDLSCITVVSPEGEFIKVSAAGRWQEYTTGLTLYQHQVNGRYLKRRKASYTPENLIKAKADLYLMVQQSMVNKGKKKTSKKEHRYLDNNSTPLEVASSPIISVPMILENFDQSIVTSEFTAIVSPHIQNINGVTYDR